MISAATVAPTAVLCYRQHKSSGIIFDIYGKNIHSKIKIPHPSFHPSAVFPISNHIYVGDGALDVPPIPNYLYPFCIFLLSSQPYLSCGFFLTNLYTTPAIASTLFLYFRQNLITVCFFLGDQRKQDHFVCALFKLLYILFFHTHPHPFSFYLVVLFSITK